MLSRELINLAIDLEKGDRVRSRRIDLFGMAQRLRVLADGVANLEAATVTPNAHLIPSEHRHLALITTADPASAEQNVQALVNSAQLAIDRQIEAGVSRGMSKMENLLRDHLSVTRVHARRRVL